MHLARSYYNATIGDFLREAPDSIVGKIVYSHTQEVLHDQANAWQAQIDILKSQLSQFTTGHIFFEFIIPRMGNRADVVIFLDGIIFVIEFKIGSETYSAEDLRQTEGYCLDLKHFHEGSHNLPIVPILVATNASASDLELVPGGDNVYVPIRSDGSNLRSALNLGRALQSDKKYDSLTWARAPYKPTPTIIEAAQALYANHSVEDIARNDAGAENLGRTSSFLREVISLSKTTKRKSICFVTGVPGSGKTLVGLDIATSSPEQEHAVFLSGNGPLVAVLREALARDDRVRESISIDQARRKVQSFIQNIHHFRDEALRDPNPPTEQVVIFDEAQRAWDKRHTEKFMVGKRAQLQWQISEPEFLIEIMNRHTDWCVIIALIGGGQEINSGEIGLQGWVDAIQSQYSDWDVYYSDRLHNDDYAGGNVDFSPLRNEVCIAENSLHLSISMRSFRAETLSDMVHHLVANEPAQAAEIYKNICDRFPIRITRDLDKAKKWISSHSRGIDSRGVIASSGAIRLKPLGIFVKEPLTAPIWFLNGPNDIRSSYFLEDVATEFDVQGLELDWCLVAWDADLRYTEGDFQHWDFSGSSWKRKNQEANQRYLENAYRVLLTRARQGMVIFVPPGNPFDHTRLPEYYDDTYRYLRECGIEAI